MTPDEIARFITDDPNDTIAEGRFRRRGDGHGLTYSKTVEEIDVYGDGSLWAAVDFDFTFDAYREERPTWGYHGGDPGSPAYAEVYDFKIRDIKYFDDQFNQVQVQTTPEMMAKFQQLGQSMLEDPKLAEEALQDAGQREEDQAYADADREYDRRKDEGLL